MVFVLCAILSAAGLSEPTRAERIARVSVTVLNPHRASSDGWKPAARRNQREIVKKEKDGRSVLIRVTEFE